MTIKSIKNDRLIDRKAFRTHADIIQEMSQRRNMIEAESRQSKVGWIIAFVLTILFNIYLIDRGY